MEKTNRIFLRTEDALKDLIKHRAKEQGIGMSAYLRRLALKDCAGINTNQINN